MKLPKALNEATAGAALKYHIKRALERSHSISEFSKNLELSAQKSHFSNNTLKIIEELNNGVKQASEEIKEKVTKYEKALQELQKIDESKLTKEQQQVLKVFKGELDQAEVKGIDLNDLYILEQGTRHAGARKILRKHYGEENTGGVTNDELLNMSELIKNGSVLLESFERLKNGFRYAYEWENNGVKLRLVVDDLNNGNKIFDFHRNFKDFRDASLHSGNHPYQPNTTQKPLTDQEDLLKNTELNNETTQEATQKATPNAKNLSPLEQAEAEKIAKLQDAITPLKQFGKNYAEFVLKPKEALEKLLQEKNGQVAGAAFREDLGGIDLVWGTPKTKDSNGYGLAHILERRISNEMKKGLSEAEAKEYALNIVKSIPEVLEKGTKGTDSLGRVFVDYENKRVGLNNEWKNEKLENHWVISSYELYDTEKQALRSTPQAITKEKAFNSLNSVEPNPTQKPLTDQEDLLKNRELENETTQEATQKATQNAKNLSPLEQANAEKLAKLQDAITPLKQFGKNYAEFVLKPKEALEKLLQEKNGQVAGAAFREDLGGIDFVWGKDGKDGYGLAHILEKREKQYTRLGLNAEQIKERTDELLKSIPEVIENGTLFKDDLGRVSVELNNIRVGLKNTWDNDNLNNHFLVTSYERDEKVLRELETKPPLSNDYKDNSNYSVLNLNENNSTKESLTSQEPPLSILEKSQLEKQKKLESERLAKAEKERAQKIKNKEEAELRDKIRAQKNATLGKSELDREIAKRENIPYKELESAPKTSVSLNDDEIHPLKFVIVNKSDLKPNFKNTGTQTRTAVDSKKVEEIAERFDPKLIIGRGGFDDLPIILQDGQVIAGNHRIQGMLNFNAESRKKYEQAIKENFNIELKPDELLVRMPEQELNDKEIFKLASKSNENRANSFSDTLLSAISSYNDKLKHLAPKFESDSVENLANQVARVLERDAKIPSHTQVENANIALLSHYARNTPNNSFLEVFDNAYKNLDREQFKAFKEMFAYNSANFHNLNNDTMFKKFTISPYLTDAIDTSAKMLESGNRADNFSKLVNDINYLVNSTDENGMNAFIKENKDAYHSVISELLGSSFARFLRLENPSAQFYEFLVKAKDRMIENAADIFSGTSKPIHQINIFDFIKYGIESGRSSKESRELLDLLPELEKKFNAHEKFLQGDKK